MESEIFDMHIREALIGDISIMAECHRQMFEEIWQKKGEHLENVKAIEIEKAYTQKLETEIYSGTCKTWVIEDKGEIISSGAITFVSFVPTPYDVSSKIAYLHSAYTRKSHRNRKCAQRIVRAAISYCRSHGVNTIILGASNAGKPIYEKIGFRSTPEMMRLFIDKNT
jgi:GNAT superfamily N-acetyltransferase